MPLPPPPALGLSSTGKPTSTAAAGRPRRPDMPARSGPGRRDAGGLHGLLGADLVAHRLDRGDRRADEDDPGLLAAPGELDVLDRKP
jgi:hypothetical protein